MNGREKRREVVDVSLVNAGQQAEPAEIRHREAAYFSTGFQRPADAAGSIGTAGKLWSRDREGAGYDA